MLSFKKFQLYISVIHFAWLKKDFGITLINFLHQTMHKFKEIGYTFKNFCHLLCIGFKHEFQQYIGIKILA